VSEINNSWFHCGRCGSLFLAEPGVTDERTCTTCGRDPSLGIITPLSKQEIPGPASQGEADNAVKSRGRGRKGERSRKPKFLMAKLATGWVLVLIMIVFMANRCYKGGGNKDRAWQPKEERKMTQEEANFLQDNAGMCNMLLNGYFAAATMEERNQYVLNPVSTVSDITRFFAVNPNVSVERETLRNVGMSVIYLPEGEAIEGQWKSKDGKIVDAVFRKESGEWRIDWHHLVRYSDYSWPLYLAGSGDDEGEFRLLVRQRLVDQARETKPLSLVFYAPRFGDPKEAGAQSPEFTVPRDSRDGLLLAEAFRQADEKKRIFGSLLPEVNPDGMVRVRVKVRRINDELERRFELVEVVACHWLELDDPGIDLDAKDQEESD